MGGSSTRGMDYFLFARPSFISGFAQVLDVGGTLLVFNESATEDQADYFALKSDWMAVGTDLATATDELAKNALASDAQPVAVG